METDEPLTLFIESYLSHGFCIRRCGLRATSNKMLSDAYPTHFVPEYHDPLLQNTASTDAGCELHRTRCSATLARVPYSSLVDFWLSMPVQSSLTQLPTGVNKTTLSLQNFKLAVFCLGQTQLSQGMPLLLPDAWWIGTSPIPPRSV